MHLIWLLDIVVVGVLAIGVLYRSILSACVLLAAYVLPKVYLVVQLSSPPGPWGLLAFSLFTIAFARAAWATFVYHRKREKY